MNKLRVLVACEYSGRVRDAFSKKGHYALSCDILPTEQPGQHYSGDVLKILECQWDLMVAFPPCTHIAVSGARWFKEKIADGRQQMGIDFFMALANAPIDKIAIENPVGIMSSIWRKPDQIVQPFEYGHTETKKTCLWLKNLPKLIPTEMVYDEMINLPKKERSRIHYMSPGKNRSKLRSKTYSGIANCMADTWG